jgi:hypothetical protein
MLHILDEAKGGLAWAWKTDQKFPKSYPVNTDSEFVRIQKQVREYTRQVKKSEKPTGSLPEPPLPPIRFSELVEEKTIRAVFSDQNAESYDDALRRAAQGDQRALQKILNAVGHAYGIEQFGPDTIPQPRVHFLHRNLLELAALKEELAELSDPGIAEFLDDLCPCSNSHRGDTIRRLRKRMGVRSRSKP